MFRLTTILILLFTLRPAHAQPVAVTLEVAEFRYLEELQKLTNERDQRDSVLIQQYVAELLRFEVRSRNNSDLEGVLAAREEIKRVENEGVAPPAEASAHKDLAALQQMMLDQSRRHARMKGSKLLELVAGITQFAGTQSMEHTRRNDIAGAIAWRDWAQNFNTRPEVLRAKANTGLEGVVAEPANEPAIDANIQSRPLAEIHTRDVEDFVEHPRVYLMGNEPKGKEVRQTESPPSAAGSGHTRLQARLRLVDEEDILNRYNNPWSSFRQRSHLYVPRLQLTPLPGQNLDESLVVFDLYKRGSGSVREIIRTDAIRIPPIPAGGQIVVDSGVYAYQSERYRSRFAGGHRSDEANADLFHGFIVTIFDRQGRLIYQRSNDRGLNAFARTTPPPPPPPPPPAFE